jgi:hypothetical protein
MTSGERIVQSPTFQKRADWLSPGNHNHLRLTRMLRSLNLLAEREAALALFAILSEIYDEERRTGRNRISETSLRYWSAAVEG